MSWDDEGPVFRPKFGRARTGEGTRAKTFRNDVLAAIGRIRPGWSNGQRWRSRTRPPARCGVAVPIASAKSRRVIVKAHIVKMTAYGSGAARFHLAYVQREGVERDGSKGMAYGSDGPADAKAFATPIPSEKHQFRLIVSPEDAGELDMTAFARRYMASVQKDLHQPLQWMAVNHYNTDHPHVHIIIRGVDKHGEQVRMERGYISHGLRERAQDVVTRELGPRNDLDIQRQRLHDVDKARIIGLDAELKRMTENDVIDVRGRRPPRVDEKLLIRRLEHLQSLELAKRHSSTAWQLVPGWQDRLREMARHNDVIARMHRAIGGDRNRYEVHPQPEHFAGTVPIVARVAHKEICDERPNAYSIILETSDGRGLYASIVARDAEKVREGDLVVVGCSDRAAAPDGRQKAPELQLVRQPMKLEEQIRYAGPVWLDQVVPSELASRGFGRNVAEAIAQRKQTLRSHGIRPDDPERTALLRELEQRTAGERHSRMERETFLEKVPSGFRGRVSITEPSPNGTVYAAISDSSRFVLVPLTHELKAQIGKQVVVTRTEDRGLVVRGLDKNRGDRGL